LAILTIMWFHIWQQSWLMPVFSLPFLAKLGLPAYINLDFIPRSGYIFVDLTLLISAFCLFLPHARARLMGESVPGPLSFYKKRAARIIPSYYLSVFVILLFWSVPAGAFHSAKKLCVDLFSTLTFTQSFFPTALLDNKINGVLWTAAIEMQFYLLFPLLACIMRKKPLIGYTLMVAVACVFIHGYSLPSTDRLRMSTNQLPAFFAVFANGMMLAYVYIWLSQHLRKRKWITAIATIVSIVLLFLIGRMEKSVMHVNPVQLWQLKNRFLLSLAFSGFILCAALSAAWFRFLFSNKIMRFLAAISFNLYIWHQWLAVRFVEWRIPAWSGETRPNLTGDKLWQHKYTLLVILAAFAVAVITTYCFEKPIAKWLLTEKAKKMEEKPLHEDVSL